MPRRDATGAVLDGPDATLGDSRESLGNDTGTNDTDTSNQANGAGEAGTSGEGATGTGEGDELAAKRAAKRDPADIGPLELVSINVRIPNEFRATLAADAEKQETSVPQLIAKMLADAYEYKLPEPVRAPRIKKYNNPEERKAAAREAQAKTRERTKALLAAVEKGLINVNIDELVAQMKADQEANAATDTAPGASE